jgi:hypothetical protein
MALMALLLTAATLSRADSLTPLEVSVSRDTLAAGKETVVVHVEAPGQEPIQTAVLTGSGHRVSRLEPVAPDTFAWDGLDASGDAVEPGLYVIEVVKEPYLWNGAVSVKR